MNSFSNKFRNELDDLLESIYDKDSVETENNNVISAVRRLPKKYSDVIYFYYYEEYPAEDICMILGIKESTFYSRLSRARKLLKRLLNSDDYNIYR